MTPLHDNMDLETPEATALRADVACANALTLSQLLLLSRP
jgi:hypothetical protein